MSRRLPAGLLGLGLLAAIVMACLVGPIVVGVDPTVQDLRARFLPPAWVAGGSPEHLLGTDRNGRDLLARILVGGRTSLLIGVATVGLGAAIGVTTGLVAGLRRGWFDALAGRLADIQQAIPFVILALAVVGILGSSLVTLIGVLGVGSWFAWFRVVRGEVLAIREREFVMASRALGAGDGWLIRAHLLRNVAPSLVTLAGLWLPQAIVYTAGLTFLGLGVPPPTPEWGRLIADGTESIAEGWWLAVLPSGALLLLTLGLALTGDWLRDRLDPARRPI